MADSTQSQSDLSARVDEFMRLYTQHQRRLYVYLLSLLHNVADAEELMQQTSYILWKKFDTFREPKKGTGPICAKHPEGHSGKLDLSPFSRGRRAVLGPGPAGWPIWKCSSSARGAIRESCR